MTTLSKEEYKTVIEDYNLTVDITTLGHTLNPLLERTVRKYESNAAVVCGDEEISYGVLNSLANRFARLMIAQGICQGDVVGVALDRSVDLMIVLLAALKSGAAYVPIDPAFPADRIKHILNDACPKLVVVSSDTAKSLAAWTGTQLSIEEDWRSTGDDSNLNITIQPSDLAYIIYTSGSTGRPKGVEIAHEALSNMLLSMKRVTECNESDRLLALATIVFDMAVVDVWLPLLCGATLVIAKQHQAKDVNSIFMLLRHHKITMMQGTPSRWQMLLDYGWPDDIDRLTKILCGGEALSRQLADRLLAICRNGTIWNMYGPTEAAVWTSSSKLQHGIALSIGKPLANYQLYVLDNDLVPVALGSIGELYIGGSGLARGYHNNPDLTRASFVPNPFHGNRMYRTGDLARWSKTGELSIVGRADSQVKVRGHRIELSDVESAIMEHEGISNTVVAIRDEWLAAYCTRSELGEGEFAKLALSDLLRPWLTERLPYYMVPAFFIELDEFPLSPNGKVDRKALPSPTLDLRQRQPGTNPATRLESHLLDIWRRVLGHDQVRINDNFFEIGGDSIRVVRVQVGLEKLLGRPLSTAKLFEHFTIKSLAEYLAKMDNGETPLDPEPVRSRQRLSSENEDIAVVSMSCRLPGGITTPEDYWELLVNGVDAITAVPKDRWDADDLYDEDPSTPGKSHCLQGGFLSSIDAFDASFFGISPREAKAMDPAQYVVLETCWEMFERAGYTPKQLRGSDTAVFIGVSNIAAYSNQARDYADLDGYACTGTAGATISGRISYILGLEGPTLTIDTACSSSLVTTHLACTALRRGECDIAVAGGITLMLTPGLHIEFSRMGGMSSDGRCRAFSSDAQGTGWADGAATVMLKRLSDAQRDGDTIHAVLRGSAVNHGGRSASITTPSSQAQEKLIRSALAAAGLRPSDMDYVEAHGTATKLGDPIEGAALASVFRGSRPISAEPLWIGSAKSNLGHTQAASGLTGLIKVILAMRHNVLPRTLHINEPTPLIDWRGAGMAPIQQNRDWVRRDDRPRRAGVSSFGIGGTNAHVIVEEAPTQKPTVGEVEDGTHQNPPELLPFVISGHTDAALSQQVQKLHSELRTKAKSHRLSDIAFSLATTRNHFDQRMVLIARGELELLEKLSVVPTDTIRTPKGHDHNEPRLAMLFTGQGSQWPGMGRGLAEQFPVFREALDDIASLFDSALGRPLLEVMWSQENGEAAALLQRTDYAQCALFSLQVALWRLWKSWGIQPEVVLGHSIGEFAAAYVAGVFSLADACRMVVARGRLMHELPSGRMVSLEVGAGDVEDAIFLLGLDNKVCIASLNTPTQTVVSGDVDAVDTLSTHFSIQGRKTKALAVSHAFHSHHVDDMLDEFLAIVKTTTFSPPTTRFISTVTGKPCGMGQIETASYWIQQARQPVRFSDGMQTLFEEGIEVFVELGPRPVLCGLGAMCAMDENKINSVGWLPSLACGRDDIEVIQNSLAKLHVQHASVDWFEYFRPFGCRRVDLPSYAFQRERFRPERQKHSSIATANRTSAGGVHYKYSINWHQVQPDDPKTTRGLWGLISPVREVGWVTEVESALLRAGIKVHTISNIKDATDPRLDLDGVLCLWHSDADVLLQTRTLAAEALAQLVEAVDTAFTPPIIWVTHGAVGTGTGDRLDGLGASVLWGLMRTARSEHPELRLRLLDLGTEEKVNTEALASCLMLEDWDECAIRNGQIFVPRMECIETSPQYGDLPMNRNLLRCDGVVLITGGTGGIGRFVARWLVRKHGIRDLVLTSRRGMSAPGADELIRELASLGAKAEIVAGDMAEVNDVANIMAMFHKDRPLRGVIHAAGVIDDGVLTALTPSRCDTTFRPKLDGAWHLHQLTRNTDLSFFVMFSSISGIMGTAGQGNYAAANTFIDSLAYLRRKENLPATSVAWGLWGGEGMGANLNETGKVRYLNFGLHQLKPEHGVELLEQSVHDGKALTVAAAYDLQQLQNYYDGRQERPQLLLSLIGSPKESQGKVPTINSGEDHSLRAKLRCANPEDRTAVVLAMVQETVAAILGFTSPDQVNVHLPLQKLGIDSLTAILTRGRLADLTGLTLSPRIVFDYPTLTALSQFLLSQIQDSMESSSSDSVSTGSTTASSIDLEGPVLNMSAIRQGCLDPELTFDNTAQYTHLERPKSVLVTGGTGFVGSFIIHQLLEMGVEAYCLVRADSVEHATARLRTRLSQYGLWQSSYNPLFKVVVGDMEQPLLGLDEDMFDWLANQVHAVCHSSALVDWMRPLDDYIRPNIVSTHEVLRLASRGHPKAVHLISTVATLPKYFGTEIPKEEREFGYATSKWIAEQMVTAARWRGARASIYRLPFVSASASAGQFRHDRGDFMHNLIAGSMDLGWFPRIDTDLSAVLPVDYLAQTVVTILTQEPSRLGQDFDFLNTKAPTLDNFFNLLSVASQSKGLLPFAEWRRRSLAYAAAHSASSLARISVVIDMLTEDGAIRMIKATAVGKNVLGSIDYSAPVIDEQYARKYVDRIKVSQEH